MKKINSNKISKDFKKKLFTTIYFAIFIQIIYFTINISSQNYATQNTPWQAPMANNNITNQPIIGVNNTTISGNNQNIPNSNYTWTNQTQIDPLNKQTDTNVNWQERKILKQKMNLVYSKIVNIIDDSKLVIEKFSNKINDFNRLHQDCIDEITIKIKNKLNISIQPNDIKVIAQKLFHLCNNIKKTDLYNSNKDFAEKVDQNDFTLKNIQAMINHGIDSLIILENAIHTINNSIINLSTVMNSIEDYENTAWNAYQKIDELISEDNANYNNDIINNCLKNIENLNNYLRNDFLTYINDSISNMDASVDNINSLYENIIKSIQEQNEIISQFEKECNQFIILEEERKNKLIQEQKQQEAEKKELEEKKKRDELLKLEQSKTILDKIFLFINSAYSSIIKTISNFFIEKIQIQKIISILPKKNISHQAASKKIDNTVVNKNISNYVAPQDGFIKEETFTLTTNNNVDIQHIDKIPELNKNIQINNIDKSEISDVFHNQKPQIYPSQQVIPGAASYPIDIIPEIAILNAADAEEEKTILPFGLETNLVNNNSIDSMNITKEENENNNNYHYLPMEINQTQNDNQNNQLLPDLSNNMNNNFTSNAIGRNGMANNSQSTNQNNNMQSSNEPTHITQNTLETRQAAINKQTNKQEKKTLTNHPTKRHKTNKLKKIKKN